MKTRAVCVSFLQVVFVVLALMAFPTRGATLSVSPGAITNNYTGTLTLEIGGLNAGETVRVEHFLDVKGNGAVDAEDFLMQSFPLTDGQAVVVGGVTNLHAPGDLGSAPGAITARFEMGGTFFDQRFVGKHLYRLSSPASRFTPVLATLTVNNFAYGQQLSGNVKSAGANVPYAGLVLLRMGPGNDMEPVLGVVADASGHYSLSAPPGTFVLLGFKSGYVAELGSAPPVTLPAGANLTADPPLTAGTRTISGRVTDQQNASVGLAGVLLTSQSSDYRFSITYTDQNGNFTLPAGTGGWEIYPDESALRLLQYVSRQSGTQVDTTSGNATGISIQADKATALIAGTVRTAAGQIMSGVRMWAASRDDVYECSPTTDQSGRYFMPVLAGTWYVETDNNSPDYAGYIFTRPSSDPVMSPGQALTQDFTGQVAPYTVSGTIRDSSNSTVGGVGVYGHTELGGVVYNAYTQSDDQGRYSLPAINGLWWVGLSCDGDNGLSSRGYRCAGELQGTVSGSNVTLDFRVQSCTGLTITTEGLPQAQTGVYYSVQLFAESCNSQNIIWSVSPGSSLPNGMNLQPTGFLTGTPTQAGTRTFSVRANDGTQTMDKSLSLTITSNPLQVDTGGLPNGTVGVAYTIQFQASGGSAPYTWSLAQGSAALPNGINLSTAGVLSGTTGATGTFYFRVRVTDAKSATAEQILALTFLAPPISIVTTSLPNGKVGVPYTARVEATGGQAPYDWTVSAGSANLPDGLSLTASTGNITGTPTVAGTFYFYLRVFDSGNPIQQLERQYSVTIDAGEVVRPTLTVPGFSAGQFQFTINGTTGLAYTIQFSTDLATWTPIGTTVAPGPSFLYRHEIAAGKAGFYRVVAGP